MIFRTLVASGGARRSSSIRIVVYKFRNCANCFAVCIHLWTSIARLQTHLTCISTPHLFAVFFVLRPMSLLTSVTRQMTLNQSENELWTHFASQ
jgi:hypothetical protein